MMIPSISPTVARIAANRIPNGRVHHLPAEIDTCSWGYIDARTEPVISIESGDTVDIETITHHAGDAPDLMMDDRIRALWEGIPEADRGPGVHVITGPIHVAGAEPGDTLVVQIEELVPRVPFGSNCAANWGLLYEQMQKERITIYELGGYGNADREWLDAIAKPAFAFDFATRPMYDLPGVMTEPDPSSREAISVEFRVPVRPHFGLLGVAPATAERLSSIPPGRFGGNVDNWRFGPGAVVCYPVFQTGGLAYAGDPHFSQGDGEICGTAIEASLNGRVRMHVAKDVSVSSPVLETPDAWHVHGFGNSLDEAMTMSAEQMLWLLTEQFHLSLDDAYSLCSVAVDFGVTQVVDGTVGCHGTLTKRVFS